MYICCVIYISNSVYSSVNSDRLPFCWNLKLQENNWVRCDDSIITPMSQRIMLAMISGTGSVDDPSAYLLCYTRIDDAAVSSSSTAAATQAGNLPADIRSPSSTSSIQPAGNTDLVAGAVSSLLSTGRSSLPPHSISTAASASADSSTSSTVSTTTTTISTTTTTSNLGSSTLPTAATATTAATAATGSGSTVLLSRDSAAKREFLQTNRLPSLIQTAQLERQFQLSLMQLSQLHRGMSVSLNSGRRVDTCCSNHCFRLLDLSQQDYQTYRHKFSGLPHELHNQPTSNRSSDNLVVNDEVFPLLTDDEYLILIVTTLRAAHVTVCWQWVSWVFGVGHHRARVMIDVVPYIVVLRVCISKFLHPPSHIECFFPVLLGFAWPQSCRSASSAAQVHKATVEQAVQ